VTRLVLVKFIIFAAISFDFHQNPTHLLFFVIIVSIIFTPVRQWLESITVNDSQKAHTVCQLIPASCPFERKITFFNRTILKIPPLCKLNPFYEQLMMLRFKALTYLADECGEDITIYC
jgi:Mo-dependent nitrogenase C-terminus